MFENKLPLIPKLPALRIRGMWVAENWRIALSVYIVPSDPLTHLHSHANTYAYACIHTFRHTNKNKSLEKNTSLVADVSHLVNLIDNK